MKTIAFFNNKGGVGKTTLVYHVAWMFSELGYRVVAADFDPQANLTAMSLRNSELALLENDEIKSIFDVVAPLISDGKELRPDIFEIVSGFGIIPGDLDLSNTEDSLSREWTESGGDSQVAKKRAFTVTTALARAVRHGGEDYAADIALIDIGPNLGAINRCALLAADYVVVPVAPDVFSLKGLTNVGRGLSDWKKGWDRRIAEAPRSLEDWPNGSMRPLGYVVSRFSTYAGEKSYHFRSWINQVPKTFHRDVLVELDEYSKSIEEDQSCLAWLKDYRSLMPMSHTAKKPIFKLRPGDGAIGSHQNAVTSAYDDFKNLCENMLNHINT